MKDQFSVNSHESIYYSIHDRLPRKEKKKMKKTLGENAYKKLAIAFNRTYLFKCEKETKLMARGKCGYISTNEIIRKGQKFNLIVYSNIVSRKFYLLFLKKKQLKENFTLVKKTGLPYRKKKTTVNKFRKKGYDI